MGYLSCRTEAATGTCETVHQKQKRQRKQQQRPESPHVFPFSELKAATEGFAEECLLGKGSHGLVYKGVLKDGKEVAVKRATYARQLLQDESSFDNELEILSKIWSDRLVNLLGYTREEDEKLLVVEFMSNGTLHDNLHDTSSFPMSWTMRIHLALQTAKGIFTLHSSSPPIIHRDIKSSNVLIDAKWNAKLGDFGLALRGHIEDMANISTPPAGTMGYLDPEYETPSDLSTKTDVFSFGILLLEIISGRNAIDLAYEPPSILDWALPLIKQGRLSEVLDKKVPVPGNMKPMKQMIQLATKCVRTSRHRRPSMFDVVEDLKDVYRKASVASLDGISRAVRRGMHSQRPGWPGASARRAIASSSQSHHKRLLSQVTERLEARVADEGSTPTYNSADDDAGRRVSTTDYPESEMGVLDECFKSASASFRSSSASASMDLDEDMGDEDALSATSSRPAKPRSRVSTSKKPATPLSPCISPPPGVSSHELGLTRDPAAEGMEDLALDPLCELTQIRDLIISQYDLVEHPVSRSSSRRSGSGSNQQARLLELENAQLKAMNDVFRTNELDPNPHESQVFTTPITNEDTTVGASRRTAYVAIKTLATTCLGSTLRPCVRLKEEEELSRPYIETTT